MRVGVDEARRDHEPAGVDHAPGLATEPAPDGGDAVALDGDVGGRGRRARAVHERAVADQERPGHDYVSRIVTRAIRSPCLMRSTCSMPATTRPKTV